MKQRLFDTFKTTSPWAYVASSQEVLVKFDNQMAPSEHYHVVVSLLWGSLKKFFSVGPEIYDSWPEHWFKKWLVLILHKANIINMT